MLIIFQSGNFQSSTPVAVRVFKTGMLKLHGREIQRMLGGEKYNNNVRRRKYKNVRRRKYKVAGQARENTWSGDKNADSLVCDLRTLTDLACQLDAPAPSWNVSFSTQHTHVQNLDSKYTQIQATCHHLRFMCHFHQSCRKEGHEADFTSGASSKWCQDWLELILRKQVCK